MPFVMIFFTVHLIRDCLHQGFLGFQALADYLLDLLDAEDAAFDLHLYPQACALALQRRD